MVGGPFSFTFRKGALEHAAASSRDEDLPRFLVAKGVVQPAQLAEAEVRSIAAWLECLTGEIPVDYIKPRGGL